MAGLVDRLRVRSKTSDDRNQKADDVERLARELRDDWQTCTSGVKGTSFYMHAALHHLPDQIRSLPVNILLASGEAFEAKNQQLKRILRRHVFFSNQYLFTSSRRTNKRQRKAHSGLRGVSSSSRSFQALKREILIRWVHWNPLPQPELDFVPPSKVEQDRKLSRKLEKGHAIKKLKRDNE